MDDSSWETSVNNKQFIFMEGNGSQEANDALK